MRHLHAACAWLCLVALVPGVGHFFLTPHGVCPEHGEITHTRGEHAHPIAARLSSVDDHGVSVFTQGTRPASATDDDHCLQASDRRGQLQPPRGALAVAAPEAISISWPTRQVRTSGRPLYALAPKGSPPA